MFFLDKYMNVLAVHLYNKRSFFGPRDYTSLPSSFHFLFGSLHFPRVAPYGVYTVKLRRSRGLISLFGGRASRVGTNVPGQATTREGAMT